VSGRAGEADGHAGKAGMAFERHRKRCLSRTSVCVGGRERFEQFAHDGFEACGVNLQPMPIELDPPQPEPVRRAIERLLEAGEAAGDPWWVAGVEEALGSDDGAPAQNAWGGPRVVEP
jgi:hypothetical protein